MKNIISFNQYDTFITENNLDRHKFIHTYFVLVCKKLYPDINFTTIGDNQINWPDEYLFPDNSVMLAEIQKIIVTEEKEKGMFEQCYEDGILVKSAYTYPSELPKVLELIAELPQLFNLSGAFSIAEGGPNAVYTEQYISVYYKGNYQNTDSSSFAYKISKATKETIDIKLISNNVPVEYVQFIPENKTSALFGSFLNDPAFVEVGFSFQTEQEYSDFLGLHYVAPLEYSRLGKGMVALTIDTTSKAVVRTKRYFL